MAVVRTNLVLTAVESARRAREELADTLHALDEELTRDGRGAEIRSRVTSAIGSLYTVELGDPERIDRGLAEARDTASRLLSELQQRGEGPDALVASVARALSRLHPASEAIARHLVRR